MFSVAPRAPDGKRTRQRARLNLTTVFGSSMRVMRPALVKRCASELAEAAFRRDRAGLNLVALSNGD
jgi:hypothetical protein